MINSFDRPACMHLRSQVIQALEKVASDLGIDVSCSGGRFSDIKYSAKFEFSVKENKDGKSKNQAEFESFSFMYSLPKDALGKTFKVVDMAGADTYKITGIKPNSRKYPIIGEDLRTGKRYKFSAEQVRLGLKLAAEK